MNQLCFLAALFLLSFSAAAQKTPEEEKRWAGIIDKQTAELESACEQDDLYACAELGHRIYFGKAPEVKNGDAIALLRRSCEADVAWACRDLGNAFNDYTDFEKSLKEAIPIWIKSCELGVAEACWLAGRRLASESADIQQKILGLRALFFGCFEPKWFHLSSCATAVSMAQKTHAVPEIAEYLKTVPGPLQVYNHGCKPSHMGLVGLYSVCAPVVKHCENGVSGLHCEFAEKFVRHEKLRAKCEASGRRDVCEPYEALKKEMPKGPKL